MAPRTLSSTWKQFERLVGKYTAQPQPADTATAQLDDLVRRTNSSKINTALSTLFVEPYPDMAEVSVLFAASGEDGYPDWTTTFSSQDKAILVNPVGVLKFCQKCQEAAEQLATATARENFLTYRYHAYLGELGKLPSQYMLFLLVLQEVANTRRITEVEKKGGGKERAEDETYINLLWAFKELETFYRANSGMNLRSEYGILWHECDWACGN